jgi:GMP synthase (glutamine-hydrolysing)
LECYLFENVPAEILSFDNIGRWPDGAELRRITVDSESSSVYEPGSPTIDPNVLRSGTAVLGICYGQQLMAYLLGGSVRKGDKGEYEFATLEIGSAAPILSGLEGPQQV